MTRKLQWSLDALDRETKEIAREAARAAGMTLEQWVATVIADQSGKPAPEGAPGARRTKLHADMDAVAEKLATAARASSPGGRDVEALVARVSAESERRDREAADKTAAALDSVARWIERAEARLDETTRVASEHHERTSTILGEALTLMTSRLDEIEQKVADGQEPAMAAALKAVEAVERLEQHIAAAGAERDAAQNARIEQALQGFEERIARIADQVTRATVQPPARRAARPEDAVRSAVAEIRRRQSELEDDGAGAARFVHGRPVVQGGESRSQTDMLVSLKSDIAHLAGRIGSLQAGADITLLRDEIGRVEKGMESLATRDEVGAIERAVRDLARQVAHASAPGDVAGMSEPIAAMHGELARLAGVAGRDLQSRFAAEIDALASKLDDAAETGADPQAVAGMRDQVAQLSGLLARAADPDRIETLAAEVAELSRQVGEVAGRQLEAITSKLDALMDRGAGPDLGEVTRELDRLSNRMEGALLSKDGAAPMEPLLERLDRLSETLRRPASEPELKPLEEMLRSLADKLDSERSSGSGRNLDAIEKQIAALAARLDRPSGSDPALATLERTMGDLMVRVDTLREASPDLGALKRDVADLKVRQGASDQRTQDTLATLNATLERLAARLGGSEAGEPRPLPAAEDLEQAIRNARAAAPAEPDSPMLRARSDEVLLEPGSARPRRSGADNVSSPAGPADSDVKASFIAAARRAAQAAAAEAAGAKKPATAAPRILAGEDRPAPGLASRVRATIDKRRRSILYGLAAIVLALGAFQLGKDFLGGSQKTQTASSPARIEPTPPPSVKSEPTTTESLPSTAAPRTAAAERQTEGSQASVTAAAKPRDAAPSTAERDGTAGAKPGDRPAGQQTAKADAPAPAAASPAAPAASLGRIPDMAALAPEIPANAPAPVRQAALAGDPGAVFDLAARAADGRGLPRDLKLAAKLFEKAASQGIAPAQYRLGNHYEKGLGVPRDLALAKTWYQRAAEKGNARAMHNYAVLLAQASAHGKPEYGEAVTWFRRAAEQGVRDSQFNLAVLLARGLGTQQNLVESYTWFAVAAGQGDEDAGKKRDEVGQRLSAPDLATAKAAAEGWRAQALNQAANEPPASATAWGEAAPAKPAPAAGRKV